MSVLLLRLVGPMQSWGVQSRFSQRDTGFEPSKSGVLGILAAAQGRHRHESVEDLARLTMGVRVDCQGSVMRDYQTAKDVRLASAKSHRDVRDSVSTRYYLSDARFLVGLGGDDLGLLKQLHNALRDPVWPLYLGRKAFVPGEPVWLPDGLRPGEDLETALRAYPWLGCPPRKPPERVRLVLEDDGGSEVRPDQPLSFAERRFAPRRVRTGFIPAPPVMEEKEWLCIYLD